MSAVAFVHPTWAVLALVATLGIGQAVNGAGWQALLATVVEGDTLTRAIGRTQVGRTAAGLKHNEFLKSQMVLEDFRLVLKVKLAPNRRLKTDEETQPSPA